MAEPLARTTVEIDADLQKLNAKLSEVEQKLDKTGTEGARAGKKMKGGIDRAAKSAERFQSIVSKLFIPAAVFAAVTRLVRLFRDLTTASERTKKAMEDTFKGAEKAAMEFRRRGLSDLQKDLAALNDEMRTTEEQIRKAFEESANPETLTGLVKTLFGSSEDYDEAVEKLRKVYAELRKAAVEANRDALADTRRRLDAEVLSSQAALAEIEAAELQRQGKFEDAAKKRAEALGASYLSELDAIRQAEREFQSVFGVSGEQFRFMRQALEAMHKLRMKQVNDEAKESADAYRREMEQAIEDIQARLQTAFGFNSGGLNNIVGAINGLRTEVQRRRN
jgi:phage-related minor tail protein